MRHPGFGLPYGANVFAAILQYLAAKVFVDPSVFAAYGLRAQIPPVNNWSGGAPHGVSIVIH